MALFEKHVHVHVTVPLLNDVLNLLQGQAKQIQIIMANFQEIKDLIAEQNTLIEEIAGDIDELVGKLEGGLSAEESTQVIEALKSNVDKLKNAAQVVPEPE